MFIRRRRSRSRQVVESAATRDRGRSRPLTAALGAGVLVFSGLMLAGVAPAHAEDGVPYLDDLGRSQTVDAITVLAGGGATTLTPGWYLCETTVAYSATVTVSGEVSLILGDGCDMTVTGSDAGIEVTGTNSLSVYGQSEDPGSTGKLTVRGDEAGIGGGAGDAGGIVTINGGTVTATGHDGAGIGGGDGGDGGVVTINGGTVTATGGASRSGAGIGGGYQGDGGVVTINGGTVTATGSEEDDGAGIGGSTADGGVITINGGTVTAEAYDGAGIGGGTNSDGGLVTITGGTVNARNIGWWGAGIGGGVAGAGGTIVITGGAVTAHGGGGSAGIGGGVGYGNRGVGGDSGRITIAGNADVTATGGPAVPVPDAAVGGGAAIGSGGGYLEPGEVGTGSITVAPSATVAVIPGADSESSSGGATATGGSAFGYGGASAAYALTAISEGRFGTVAPVTAVITHRISVAPLTGGGVTPGSGGLTVPDGANQTFRVVPDPGAYLVSVSADNGTVHGAGSTWTVADITADTTLTVVFEQPITAADLTLTAPATGAGPATTATTSDEGYTVDSVSWSPAEVPAKPSTAYTATITLTAATGHSFTEATTATVNGQSAPLTPSTDHTSATVVYQFPATAATAAPRLMLSAGPTAGTVTATLSDAYPNVADIPVTFTWTDETSQATGTACPTAATDTSGTARCALSELAPGTYTISASTLADPDNDPASDSITGYVVAPPVDPGTGSDPGNGTAAGTGGDPDSGTGGETGTGTGDSGTGDAPTPRPPWRGMPGRDRDHDGLPDAIDPAPGKATPWRTAGNGDLIIGSGKLVTFAAYHQPHGHRIDRSAKGRSGTYLLTFRVRARGRAVGTGVARLVDTDGRVLTRAGRPGRKGIITFRYNPANNAEPGTLHARIIYLGVTGTYAGRGSTRSWPITITR